MIVNVDVPKSGTKEYRAAWYQKNKEKHYAYVKKFRQTHGIPPEYHTRWKAKNTQTYLLKMAKNRAKRKGLEFSITKEDIPIPEVCPFLGHELNANSVGYNPWFPSIDRIDSSKGYIKGNVQVISVLANRMKWDATEEQLILFAEGVLRKAGRAFAD